MPPWPKSNTQDVLYGIYGHPTVGPWHIAHLTCRSKHNCIVCDWVCLVDYDRRTTMKTSDSKATEHGTRLMNFLRPPGVYS